jgi:MerR family copper efflux transcriptional regulator
MSTSMNIGQAARQAGVSAKMVRHYESLGLLAKIARTDSGYRQYEERDVHTLRFIRRGRDLGFSMAEIADLLKLWQNRRRASADVKRIALAHVADLDRRMVEMAAMKKTLEKLADCCRGDERPECPILDELGSVTASAVKAVHARAVIAVKQHQHKEQGADDGNPRRVARPRRSAHGR